MCKTRRISAHCLSTYCYKRIRLLTRFYNRCRRWTNRGLGQNMACTVPSTESSLYHHYHLADGIFDSRDTLVHAISPNVLTEVSKEVEKRTQCDIEHRLINGTRETIDYIICLLLVQHRTLVDWVAATKSKTTKINSGGFV